MAAAAKAAAQWVWRVASGRAVTVLCGPGLKGGNGYIIAEWLRERGLDVVVVAPELPRAADAVWARKLYRGDVRQQLGGRRGWVMVDALFGVGLNRPSSAAIADLLEDCRASHSFACVIDIRTGVDSDTGAWRGDPWQADLTLALGAWKPAHWLMPAMAAMGQRRLLPTGLKAGGADWAVSARPALQGPAADSHKYRRGMLGIVGGEMPGAALLAAEAATRSGAGYVKVHAYHGLINHPSDLVCDQGQLAAFLADERLAAVLVGPGLGRTEASRERLCAVLEAGKPTVLDADALHLLDWDSLEGVLTRHLVLTPHEGELAVLCSTFGVIGNGKAERVSNLRDAINASVLAKGPDTLLAPATGGLISFDPGPSWLSIAGSGDVLAGIVSSRLAATGDAGRAAEEAVWLHSAAARRAGAAFTASDLARSVSPAMTDFL